jgi:hypothetical protein
MHRKLMVRAMVAMCAVGALTPVTAVALGSGGNAYASGSQISCAKLSGNETSQKLSKCTGPLDIVGGKKAGTGTGTSTTAASAPAGYMEGQDVSWGKGGAGGSIVVGINFSEASGCPGKDLTIVESGTVVSGTGNASALIGDTATGTACLNTKGAGKLSNEKGSDFTY